MWRDTIFTDSYYDKKSGPLSKSENVADIDNGNAAH